MARFTSPLEHSISAYKAKVPDEAAQPMDKGEMEEAAFWGVELYEWMLQKYGLPLDDGLKALCALDGDKASEAVAVFRVWLNYTDGVVMPAINQIERTERTNISNSQNLRAYVARMSDLLNEWDAKMTQANATYREIDVGPEASEKMADALTSGRGRVKFRNSVGTKS